MPSASLAKAGDAGVSFEPFSDAFAQVVDQNAAPRLLGTGHWWSEGPAWDSERQRLYFTDVPRNRAYVWEEGAGQSIFLDPSGLEAELATGMSEPGANGLLLSQSGELLICNHGKRCVEAREFDGGARRVLASHFEGKRFNSPNDLVEMSDGTIFFTDPPYGLDGRNASPVKEMAVNGVYRLDPDGTVTRVIADMTFPNGVVVSPDESWLYVSQSDPDAPLVRRFALKEGRAVELEDRSIWFDAKPYMQGVSGLPDGMAVSVEGHIMLAGPGGVLVIDASGECLGRIATGRASANCTFGEDGRTLFVTAGDRLVAVRTVVPGMGRF